MFLDTNVLVSAFATRGLCADLLEVVLLEHELVTGEGGLAELKRALRGKLKLPVRQCEDIIQYLRDTTAECAPRSSPVSAAVDPDDASILGEAIAGRAEIFVTGDAAVQLVGEIEAMQIMSPREFWTALQRGR